MSGRLTPGRSYDAGGNRLIRRDPNGTTLYLPGTEVRLDKSGNIVKGTRYYQHPAGPAMVRTAEGGKVTTTYLLSDHNGTATMTVDSASGAVTRRAFMPFGEPRGVERHTQGKRAFAHTRAGGEDD